MAPLILAPRQRSDLEYLAAHNPVGRERCRAQALLWLDEGETPDQVAEALRVSRRTVYYWVERYRERDERDLVRRLADTPRPGRPRAGGGGIDSWVAEVIDTDPRQLGYHQTVWTAPLNPSSCCAPEMSTDWNTVPIATVLRPSRDHRPRCTVPTRPT